MVCDNCQKKIGTVATQEVWKSGSRNTVESGGRRLNENKLLSGKSTRYSPYTTKFSKCKVCKGTIHQPGSTYCQGLSLILLISMDSFLFYVGCAYKLGICTMCGVKILQTKNYRQSSV
ncbi:unnamed protein product [Rotaria sp. Silwood2]|nr:unnamed protein product [Rotaria sp. Silwood2]